MKIKYLGTAAYDAIPAPFCTCSVCLRSKALGGKNIRSRTQALIDEDLLIDFNADTISHFFQYHIDSNKIKNCLITHSHSDHLYVEDILIPQYSEHFTPIHYYSAQDGYDRIKKGLDNCSGMKGKATISLVEDGKIFSVNEYTILPLRANHDPNSSPLIYAIEKEGKRLLYAHDTGILYEDVISKIKNFGKLDFISLDCTGALDDHGWRNGHMNLSSDIEMVDVFKKEGMIDKDTVIVLNHFSHNGKATYEDLVNAVKNYGFIIAYDGMEVEF